MNDEIAMEIPELPPPVDIVRVPSCFSPSNFADLLRCPLSVLHGLGDHESLPPNPHALLGTLMHRTMDRVRRSVPDSEEEAIETAISVFNELLMAEERRLNTDIATRELVPLRRAVGRTAWRNKLACLKTWAAAAATTHSRGDRSFHALGYRPARSTPNTLSARTNTVQSGTERPLVLPELRLSGRPDRLERDLDGTIHITDLKTGPVSDREGRPDDKYALQVRLYALMVERIEPGVKVRLWLEGAQRIEVPWDDTVRAAVNETLWEVSTLLPEGKALAAETVASTGLNCWKCRIRHRCPSYLREAPNWWMRTSVVGPVAPFDVWGRVLDTELGGGRAAGMEIRDAAGRRVRLRGLESRIGGIPHPGAAVWFFNIEPSENLPAHGVYGHPRNFHGTAPSRAWPDALRLKVYSGHAF
jgi:CRISPR/Cas system-associated exonuclease Cas4 (RecB family)